MNPIKIHNLMKQLADDIDMARLSIEVGDTNNAMTLLDHAADRILVDYTLKKSA
jgi:hypothetical protein